MVDWTNLISAIIGGIIGTYLGAFFIYKKQQERYKNIRKIAIRALKIFKKYKIYLLSNRCSYIIKIQNKHSERMFLGMSLIFLSY